MTKINEQRLQLSFNNVSRDMSNMVDRIQELETENSQLRANFDVLVGDVEVVAEAVKEVHKENKTVINVKEEKQFIYNKASNKAHLEGCVYAMKIKPDHRLLFDTKEEFVSMNPSFCACVEA